MEDLGLTPSFWSGRRVLVTGHTGFKGAWLALWLHELGAAVTGLALAPAEPSLYAEARVEELVDSHIVDLRDQRAVAGVVAEARPQTVLHLAAQALVPEGYQDPVGTVATNVLGTVHLLEALRSRPGGGEVVVVTTDKVYANDDRGRAFSEGAPLGGKDPYSASKAACEIVTAAYRDSFLASAGWQVRTVRAGNVVGGGDYTPGRLLPDILAARAAAEALALRNPEATRPWQHVLEPLRGYLQICEALGREPGAVPPALNLGPNAESCVAVREVVEAVDRFWGGGGETAERPADFTEAARLELDIGLAEEAIGWRPRLSLGETLGLTVDWAKSRAAGEDARELTLAQIRRYAAGTTR